MDELSYLQFLLGKILQELITDFCLIWNYFERCKQIMSCVIQMDHFGILSDNLEKTFLLFAICTKDYIPFKNRGSLVIKILESQLCFITARKHAKYRKLSSFSAKFTKALYILGCRIINFLRLWYCILKESMHNRLGRFLLTMAFIFFFKLEHEM